ncbi:MAG: septum site-determining protein MinC [Rhodoferax sp.]|nr:septum site-determining protein MinC [Rhodoferax sp.]
MPARPDVQSSHATRSTFELKSAQLSLVSLILKNADLARVAQDVKEAFGTTGESPGFFEHDGVILDFTGLDAISSSHDLDQLVVTLRSCGLVPVAFRSTNTAWTQMARAVGLVEAAHETQRAKPAATVTAPATTLPMPTESAKPATLVIDKPLRSGQKIYAKGCDLVVLAMVNQGAEVVADGNIHVYAALRGKAMAGARGNTHARIFALALEPELVSIAGVYRTSENPFPRDVHGRAAQVRLSDDGQEKLLIEALKV